MANFRVEGRKSPMMAGDINGEYRPGRTTSEVDTVAIRMVTSQGTFSFQATAMEWDTVVGQVSRMKETLG